MKIILQTIMSIALTFLVMEGCGSSVKNKACIDESKISEGPCTMEYAPVCGCNGKTYTNACGARRSGLTSWTDGPCEN